MRIDIWMDFVCPYCYLGTYRLEEALRQMNIEESVELVYHSYELDPKAPLRSGRLQTEDLMRKHGITKEQAEETAEELQRQGAEIGIDLHLEQTLVTNTHDAHRVAQLVMETKPELAMDFAKRMFKHYFTEGADIGDPSLLIEAAVAIGLDRDAVIEVMVGDDYEQAVKNDIALARDVSLQGVPHFVVNQKYAISGAQATTTFVRVLTQIQEQE